MEIGSFQGDPLTWKSLQGEKGEKQLSGCGNALLTVGGTAIPRRHVEECTLAVNDGHLSEYDDTAGSQPDLMQWVIITGLIGDVS